MAKDMDLGRGIREGGILVFAASAKLDNNDACFAHGFGSGVTLLHVSALSGTRRTLILHTGRTSCLLFTLPCQVLEENFELVQGT